MVVVHMHKKFGKAIKMHKRNRTTVKSRYTGAHMSGKETRKYPVVLKPRRLEKMKRCISHLNYSFLVQIHTSKETAVHMWWSL